MLPCIFATKSMLSDGESTFTSMFDAIEKAENTFTFNFSSSKMTEFPII